MSQKPTVLISGASRGLGAETACAVATLGADLILTARSSEGLEKTAARVKAINPSLSVELHAGDLVDSNFCQSLGQAMVARGGVDAVILNAAQVEPIGSLIHTDDAQWSKAIELNLVAPARLARQLLPALIQKGGRLVTVGTGAAVSPIPSWSAYCTSKAGLLMLTRVIAAECPEVTSLSFSPGVLDTVMQQTIREKHEMMPSQLAEYFQGLHTSGNLVAPHIPGQALAWLALNAPREWTGQEMNAGDPQFMEVVRGAYNPVDA